MPVLLVLCPSCLCCACRVCAVHVLFAAVHVFVHAFACLDSSVASSIIEGVHIHIFVFTDRKNNKIQTRLITQNTNIWIWTPKKLSIFLRRLYVHLFMQHVSVLWMIGPFSCLGLATPLCLEYAILPCISCNDSLVCLLLLNIILIPLYTILPVNLNNSARDLFSRSKNSL